MSAIRYTDHLKTKEVEVEDNLIIGGNIYYEDGTLLYLDTVGNISGNIDIIEIGNVEHIESASITGSVGNIGIVGNLTQHTDSIGELTANIAMIGDIETITSMDVQSANIAGNIGTINDMNGTIANLHGGVTTIGDVTGVIETITGPVNTINNHGNIEEISGAVSTLRDGNIGTIAGDVITINNNANVGTISGNITDVRGISNVNDISGFIDTISGAIGNIGTIEHIETVNTFSGDLTANTVAQINTLVSADIDNVAQVDAIDTVTAVDNINSVSNITAITHVMGELNANVVNTISIMHNANTVHANTIITANSIDEITNANIENYNGNINAESGVYINQPMEPGYPLAVTGNAQITGNLVVTDEIYMGGNSLSNIMANITSNTQHAVNIANLFTYDDVTGNLGTVPAVSNFTVDGWINANEAVLVTGPSVSVLSLDSMASGVRWIVISSPDGSLTVNRSDGNSPADTVMTYTKLGMVGINNTNPAHALDVNGNINSRQNLYVTSNVGVGTTSPTAKLDVNGTTRLRGAVTTDNNLTVNGRIISYSSEEPMALFQSNSSSTRRLLMENIGGGAAMYRLRTRAVEGNTTHDWGISTRADTPGALVFYDYISGSNALMIDGTGNVGVGTTSPTAKLDVNGNIRARGEITSGGNISMITSETGWSGLRLATTSGSTNWGIRTSSSGQLAIADIKNNRTLMTYSATGNVGIGTTNPTAKLDVNGNIRATGEITSGGNVNLNSYWGLHTRTDRNDELSFYNYDTGQNRMTITKSGNVRIGSSPNDQNVRLHVDGRIQCNDITMRTSGSDFPRLSMINSSSEWSMSAMTNGNLVIATRPTPTTTLGVLTLSTVGTIGNARIDGTTEIHGPRVSQANGNGFVCSLSGLPVGMSSFYAIGPAATSRANIVSFTNVSGAISSGIIQIFSSLTLNSSNHMLDSAMASIRINGGVLGNIVVNESQLNQFTWSHQTQGSTWHITTEPRFASPGNYLAYSSIKIIKFN